MMIAIITGGVCNYGCFVVAVRPSRAGLRHFACCFHDVTIHGRNKMQENFDLKELMELLDTMQLRLLKEKLIEMNEVDIAAFIEELDSEKTVVVYRMLPKELASDVDVYKRQILHRGQEPSAGEPDRAGISGICLEPCTSPGVQAVPGVFQRRAHERTLREQTS